MLKKIVSKTNKIRFLITAGGTREYIDPVRYISNASSGKMGYAIAEAAKQARYDVTLISASDLQPPVGVDFVGVESAAEMFGAVKKFFKKCDCLIMTAAVSDYTPVSPRKTKIKKKKQELVLKLKPTVDILAWAGENKNDSQCVVGFALEDGDIRANAEKKMRAKKLDMIIANKLETISADSTQVEIKAVEKNWQKLPLADKSKIAEQIIKLIADLFY